MTETWHNPPAMNKKHPMTPAEAITARLLRAKGATVSMPRGILADAAEALAALPALDAERARLATDLAVAHGRHRADAATLVAASEAWETARLDLDRRISLAWRASDTAAANLNALTRAVAHREASLASVAPARVGDYLAVHGWALLQVDGNFAAYSRGSIVLDVPLHTTWRDYPRRLWEVAELVGTVEGRVPTLVLADWLAPAPGLRVAA